MRGLRELVNTSQSLRAMVIYVEDAQFVAEEMTELKEILDARGGQGLTFIEEG